MENAWVDSYLDALLSYGLSSEHTKLKHDMGEIDEERKVFAKYYVSQLLTNSSEDISAAWHRATSTKSLGERDTRLEYLSWRVWHMKQRREFAARTRAEMGAPDPNDLTTGAPLEADEEEEEDEDLGDDEAPADLPLPSAVRRAAEQMALESEAAVREGARLPALMSSKTRKRLERVAEAESEVGSEVQQIDWKDSPEKLYVVMISAHGLVRGERMELGKDPDTGGQVKYVVEVAKALAKHPAVHRVDLITRLIKDPKVDATYGVREETLYAGPEPQSGAYIVRLPFGPTGVYLRKELLWPHLRELADNAIAHVTTSLAAMAASGKKVRLYAVHGHYADAAEAAAMVASAMGSEMVMTGHSLGRNKLDHLLKTGAGTRAEIEKTYCISRRIEGEERGLDHATVVFTSTQQEVIDQWGLYDGFDVDLERALRSHKHGGRHIPKMEVIPPGLDFSRMNLAHVNREGDLEDDAASPQKDVGGGAVNGPGPDASHSLYFIGAGGSGGEDLPAIWGEIARFLRNPHKPAVLAMSRPDAKKNITTLIKAFGESSMLREMANLVLVMGNRTNIDNMAQGSQKVLDKVLRLVDAYDLYGSVAYPKRHESDQVTDIYRYAHRTRGVFVNIALQEPFGLTLIEAAAHGVPLVATMHGGPVDIIKTLRSGHLVEPSDSEKVAECILKLLTDPKHWDKCSQSGLDNITFYSWENHCRRYINCIETRKRLAATPAHKRTYTGYWGKKPMADPMAARAMEIGATWMGPFKQNARVASLGTDAIAAMSTSPGPGITFDDSMLGLSSAGMVSEDEGSQGFQSILAVAIDGHASCSETLRALKMGIAYRKATRRAKRLAIAILSLEDLDGVKTALGKVGIPLSEINYVVANAGAEMWTVTEDPQNPNDVNIESLDDYDEHIFFRWDSTTVARTVVRVATSSKDGRSMLRELRQDPGRQYPVHPFHIMLSVPSTVHAPATLKTQVLRRLRQNGIRCQMSLVQGCDVPKETYGGHLEDDSGILTADRRAVSTTASDIGDLVGGAQKTLLVGGGNVGEGPVGLGVQPCEVPWSLKEEWGERVAHAGSQDEVQAWIKALKLV